MLFVEVDASEALADRQEWEMAAKTTLFRELPERVDLVFSGAPSDFKLEEGALHFLELTLPEDAHFKQGSLHSDLPTDKDTPDIKSYAGALARFVMHSQTEPPLTIEVHGPWGKGKSSLMKQIQRLAVRRCQADLSCLVCF